MGRPAIVRVPGSPSGLQRTQELLKALDLPVPAALLSTAARPLLGHDRLPFRRATSSDERDASTFVFDAWSAPPMPDSRTRADVPQPDTRRSTADRPGSSRMSPTPPVHTTLEIGRYWPHIAGRRHRHPGSDTPRHSPLPLAPILATPPSECPPMTRPADGAAPTRANPTSNHSARRRPPLRTRHPATRARSTSATAVQETPPVTRSMIRSTQSQNSPAPTERPRPRLPVACPLLCRNSHGQVPSSNSSLTTPPTRRRSLAALLHGSQVVHSPWVALDKDIISAASGPGTETQTFSGRPLLKPLPDRRLRPGSDRRHHREQEKDRYGST